MPSSRVIRSGEIAGALQAERLDVRHREPELVPHRPDDRLPALTAEVEMSRVPPALERHREHVLRYERPEGRPGENRGEQPREAHRDDVVRRQDQLGHDDREERPVHDPRGGPPSGPAWNEHERDADEGDRERCDRQGRERVGSRFGEHRDIGGCQRHVERPGDHPVRDHERREEHHEVPEAPEDREGKDRPPSQGHDQWDGDEEVHGLRHVDECRRSQIYRGVAYGPVDAGHRTGRLPDRQDDAEENDAEEPPCPPLPACPAHERWRLT